MTSEVEWRRRWKPDLRTKSWRHLALAVGRDSSSDAGDFLIKSLFRENLYEILITDLKSMWYEKLEGDAIKKRTLKLNPSVEAPLSTLLQHIQDNIEACRKGAEYKVSIKDLEDGDSKILLTVNTKLAGMPFVWKFNGSPADKHMACYHLTRPLLGMVSELTRQQAECYKLLAAKDKEIADMKVQGARVSRKHLETVPFDETTFKNNMLASKGFVEEAQNMGPSGFNNGDSQKLYTDLMNKRAWLTHSHTHGDSEHGDNVAAEGSGAGRTIGQSWNNRLPPSLAASTSPKKSPDKSPAKSHARAATTADTSPVKDTELLRRQALLKKLADEEDKKNEPKKKKKKIKF